MKKLIACLCLMGVLVHAFCVPCLAAQPFTLAEENMTLQIPDDFSVITPKNAASMGAVLKEYGTTVTETEVKMEQNHYLMMGISSVMACTVYLAKQQNSLSYTVGDLISYSNKEMVKTAILGDSLPENVEVKELEREGALFYRVVYPAAEQSAGRIAYFTVMNYACYTLCVVDNTGKLTDNIHSLIDTMFQTWEYTVDADVQKAFQVRAQVQTVLFWVGVPALLVVIFFVIRSLRKDYIARRLEEDRQNNTPKKPRR